MPWEAIDRFFRKEYLGNRVTNPDWEDKNVNCSHRERQKPLLFRK